MSRDQRTRRAIPRLRALAALALALGGALGAAACDRRDSPPAPQVSPVEARETELLLEGIRQEGIALGDPAAPVTLVEFVDLECGHCRHFTIEILPELIRRHVRQGELRIELRTLAFVNPTSEKAARMAAAAALQDRMWHFVDLYFRSQEQADAPVDDAYLRGVVEALPGVDPSLVVGQKDAPVVTAQLVAAEELAQRHEIPGTPSFLIGKTGGELRVLESPPLSPDMFTQAIAAIREDGAPTEPPRPSGNP